MRKWAWWGCTGAAGSLSLCPRMQTSGGKWNPGEAGRFVPPLDRKTHLHLTYCKCRHIKMRKRSPWNPLSVLLSSSNMVPNHNRHLHTCTFNFAAQHSKGRITFMTNKRRCNMGSYSQALNTYRGMWCHRSYCKMSV